MVYSIYVLMSPETDGIRVCLVKGHRPPGLSEYMVKNNANNVIAVKCGTFKHKNIARHIVDTLTGMIMYDEFKSESDFINNYANQIMAKITNKYIEIAQV